MSVFRASPAGAVLVVAVRISSAMWWTGRVHIVRRLLRQLNIRFGFAALNCSRPCRAGSGRGPAEHGRAVLVDDRTRPTGLAAR